MKGTVLLPTQVDIVKRLSELSRLLDAATAEIAELDEAAVRAKSTYEVAFARSFLGVEGPMDQRKQESILACADARFHMDLAEQKVRACRERINTLRTQISTGQSLSAAVRQQFSAEATGQFT